MERMVEFHQFHRIGSKRRGVVHAIIDPFQQTVSYGWSLCDTGKGDTFDPKVGKEIARNRAQKLIERNKPDFHTTYLVMGMKWRVYHPTDTLPASMYPTLTSVAERVVRILPSIEQNRAAKQSPYMNFLDKLQEKYPAIYGKTCFIEVRDGWFPLVEKGFEITQKYRNLGVANLEVVEVKEKFGGLRFYTSHTYDTGNNLMDKFHEEIRELEEESFGTCEACGVFGSGPGYVETKSIGGWLTTLCSGCQKSRKDV